MAGTSATPEAAGTIHRLRGALRAQPKRCRRCTLPPHSIFCAYGGPVLLSSLRNSCYRPVNAIYEDHPFPPRCRLFSWSRIFIRDRAGRGLRICPVLLSHRPGSPHDAPVHRNHAGRPGDPDCSVERALAPDGRNRASPEFRSLHHSHVHRGQVGTGYYRGRRGRYPQRCQTRPSPSPERVDRRGS